MRSYSSIATKGRRASIEQIAQERASSNRGSTRSVLTNLFFKMVVTLGVHKGDRWSQLMLGYVRNPLNSIPQTKAHETSARGNLNKALTDKTMSWRSFCKGMRFLNLRRFKVIIEAHHTNGQITVHEAMVVLEDAVMDNDDDSSED